MYHVDPDALGDSPFEVDDGNYAHLFKHEHYGYDDLVELYESDPIYIPAKPGGPAEWLMVAEIAGEPPLVVPLAEPHSGDATMARPIGIYPATGGDLAEYRKARREGVRISEGEHYER
jgi:hypothetical protein